MSFFEFEAKTQTRLNSKFNNKTRKNSNSTWLKISSWKLALAYYPDCFDIWIFYVIRYPYCFGIWTDFSPDFEACINKDFVSGHCFPISYMIRYPDTQFPDWVGVRTACFGYRTLQIRFWIFVNRVWLDYRSPETRVPLYMNVKTNILPCLLEMA